MEEVIDLTVYDPRGLHVGRGCNTEWVSAIWCSNKDNCDAYKQGRCILVVKPGYASLDHDRRECPYGREENKSGFTPRSAKCGKLTNDYLAKHGDKRDALKGCWQPGLLYVGDYVRLDWKLENLFQQFLDPDQYFGKNMIRKDAFTAQLIVKMIRRSNHNSDIFGLLKYLRDNMPAMYADVKSLYPQVDDLLACKNLKCRHTGSCCMCPHYQWHGKKSACDVCSTVGNRFGF